MQKKKVAHDFRYDPRIFGALVSPLTLCSTSSFLTRSVQLIFSILPQRHIWKLPRVFRICFPDCQNFSITQLFGPDLAFPSFFLKFKSKCWWYLLIECCFSHDNPGFNFLCTSCVICYQAAHMYEMFYIFCLFFIYYKLYWAKRRGTQRGRINGFVSRIRWNGKAWLNKTSLLVSDMMNLC